MGVKRPSLTGLILKEASEQQRGDRGFVLEAVKQDGFALGFASEELRGDREVVMEAVKQNGEALFWASAELRGDHGIVLEAVKGNGFALGWVSEELRGDRETNPRNPVHFSTIEGRGLPFRCLPLLAFPWFVASGTSTGTYRT